MFSVTKFFEDAAIELINHRDGWLIRSVAAQVHMCDLGQEDRTRLHLNSFSRAINAHTQGLLLVNYPPGLLLTLSVNLLWLHVLCVRACVCVSGHAPIHRATALA